MKNFGNNVNLTLFEKIKDYLLTHMWSVNGLVALRTVAVAKFIELISAK